MDLKEIYVSVSSRHMHGFNSHGMTILDDTVKSDDIHAAVDVAMAIKLPQSSKSCIWFADYIVDERAGISDPWHSGVRLGARPRRDR